LIYVTKFQQKKNLQPLDNALKNKIKV